MAGYEDTREKIINTLMGRPAGTEIQPENHQDYALSLLDYARSIELISSSTLIGVAYYDTVPVQPNDARVTYVSAVGPGRTLTFLNFRDVNGNRISITTGKKESFLIILMWNMAYWSAELIPANVLSESDIANYYYSLVVKKTYASKAALDADVNNPIGDDGLPIEIGELVSVYNETDDTYNGLYTRVEGGWKYQGKFSDFGDVVDGGDAFTQFGGADTIDGGGAF